MPTDKSQKLNTDKLETDQPLSERDEVKKAEKRTQEQQKKLAPKKK